MASYSNLSASVSWRTSTGVQAHTEQNEGTAEPRFSVTTGEICYQKIHSRMMAKAVGSRKLRQLEKSGGVPVARRVQEAGERSSLLGVGPGGGVGDVGVRAEHPDAAQPMEFRGKLHESLFVGKCTRFTVLSQRWKTID